jgi:TPR repeat protein
MEIYRHEQAAVAAENEGNISLAIAEFERAAIGGSTYARGKLGTIFDEVVDPPQHDKAVYWYKAGVRLGDSSCAWDLAMHYSLLGKKRWYLHWLRVAESMGEPGGSEEILTERWWKKHNEGGQ